jgi:hypothetical protein
MPLGATSSGSLVFCVRIGGTLHNHRPADITERKLSQLLVLDHLNRERPMRTENGHTVETAVEARAGFLDRPVLAVLVAGTVLVIVAFGLVYLGVVKF